MNFSFVDCILDSFSQLTESQRERDAVAPSLSFSRPPPFPDLNETFRFWVAVRHLVFEAADELHCCLLYGRNEDFHCSLNADARPSHSTETKLFTERFWCAFLKANLTPAGPDQRPASLHTSDSRPGLSWFVFIPAGNLMGFKLYGHKYIQPCCTFLTCFLALLWRKHWTGR